MERDENIGLKQDKTVKLSDMDFDQLDILLFYHLFGCWSLQNTLCIINYDIFPRRLVDVSVGDGLIIILIKAASLPCLAN